MSYPSQTPSVRSNPIGLDTFLIRPDSTDRWTGLTPAPSFIAATVRQGWSNFLASLTAQRVRRLRPGSILMRIANFGLIVIAASGIGHALFHPVGDDSREAGHVVTSLAGGRATLEDVPPNFMEELGYQPVAAGETLVNPNGGCSTPGGIGPDSFTNACRVHDFGYDMLRYAEGTGTRLGAWARFDLDRRLYADLLQACDTVTCPATATVYYTAVTVNSIRQGFVAPTAEPTTPWAGMVVGVVGLAMVTAPTKGSGSDRRMDREGEHRGASRLVLGVIESGNPNLVIPAVFGDPPDGPIWAEDWPSPVWRRGSLPHESRIALTRPSRPAARCGRGSLDTHLQVRSVEFTTDAEENPPRSHPDSPAFEELESHLA